MNAASVFCSIQVILLLLLGMLGILNDPPQRFLLDILNLEINQVCNLCYFRGKGRVNIVLCLAQFL